MHQELRVAGLFLRRRRDKERPRYTAHLPYDASDYEILLRLWPSEPYKSYLSAFSGPALQGEDPEETLLRESRKWAAKLAGLFIYYGLLYHCGYLVRIISRTFFIVAGDGVSVGSDLVGRRAVFLSVHGGGRGGGEARPETSGLNLGLFLGYVVPLTCQGSIVK